MKIYYFAKLNNKTSYEHFKKYLDTDVIVCFDIEDGEGNTLLPAENPELKERKRELILQFFDNLPNEFSNIKFGFRINGSDSDEQILDNELLAKIKNTYSLFIPKVDNPENLEKTLDQIDKFNLNCREIIPIIESKKGIENLRNIKSSDKRITSVAFGHCDYNLSQNLFPFFHQDTLEYWKWVKKILEELNPSAIRFINSPYLKLNDSEFFVLILSHLNFLTKDNFGQITLTSLQNKLCSEFDSKSNFSDCIAQNRHNLKINKKDIEEYIKCFIEGNQSKSFTISKRNIFLSPQEYLSALHHLENLKKSNINFAFLGGCFPVQHNILFEDIFHQRLKRKIESSFNTNFNIDIIRYQRFLDCLEKVTKFNKEESFDYLIFHIRPEPFLRLVKLYYKYQDYSYKVHRTLNIAFLSLFRSEKYDDLVISKNVIIKEKREKSFFHRLFINLNYIAGFIAGNYFKAVKLIFTTAKDIKEYCDKNKIKFYVLTPVVSQNMKMEKYLSKKIIKHLEKKLKANGIKYISGADKEVIRNINIYFEKGDIYASKKYHEYIS